MEKYQGIKFSYSKTATSFSWDSRLEILNHWGFLFSELGLAPLHSAGAAGNLSYRTASSSFIITKSGMIPEKSLNLENYIQVTGFDRSSRTFSIEGPEIPSSETFLHNVLYGALPDINAILHGHSSLLCDYAAPLNIAVTRQYHDYGTPELANSALQIVDTKSDFFILKDHGFVALGKDIEAAGKVTLDYYLKLIKLIRNECLTPDLQ